MRAPSAGRRRVYSGHLAEQPGWTYPVRVPIQGQYALSKNLIMRYCILMSKHTSLYLDEELLREAEEILGTAGPTGTVRAALEDIVRRARLKNLTTWEVELSPADLDTLRGPRLDGPAE